MSSKGFTGAKQRAVFSVDCSKCHCLTVRQRTDFYPPMPEYWCGPRWIGFFPVSRPEDCDPGRRRAADVQRELFS
jgi:hypothetical protein